VKVCNDSQDEEEEEEEVLPPNLSANNNEQQLLANSNNGGNLNQSMGQSEVRDRGLLTTNRDRRNNDHDLNPSP